MIHNWRPHLLAVNGEKANVEYITLFNAKLLYSSISAHELL